VIDIFVAGVGTGGTMTGVSSFLKQHCSHQVLSVAVEPSASPVLSQLHAGLPQTPSPHGIQSIGARFLPDNLDLSLVDVIAQVSEEEAIDYTRRLTRQEGILAGISSGAAVAVAMRFAESPDYAGSTIVVILPDSGERYLTTQLFS